MFSANKFYNKSKTVIISALCLPFFSCMSAFYSAQKTYSKNIVQQPFDVIIVPGFPYTGGDWDKVNEIRIIWADYLFQKGYAKNIIFSGSSVYSPFVESKIMKLYAVKLGIPEKNVFSEQRAEHSTENVYYGYRLAKQLGFKKIALATDPFQTDNLRSFIHKFRIPVTLLPAIYDTVSTREIEEPCIDPSSAYVSNFVSIVDRQSLLNRLRGTFGKHIIWHEEDLKKKRFRRRFKKRMIPVGSMLNEKIN